jgi:NADH-quinone oxidoreductase subunit L
MSDITQILLIIGLPFTAFLVLGIFGNSSEILKKSAGIIGTSLMAISCFFAIQIASGYFLSPSHASGEAFSPTIVFKYVWLNFGSGKSIDIGAFVDPISAMMLVVVTFISLMVHIFSLGYMKGEERFATYYAFLGLFTFSMLGLVISANIFQIYIFWELVGVSSFLLIGYYFQKPSAVAASKKAFIVTRFADLGFLIGILTLGFYSETFDFQELIARLSNHQTPQFLAIASASFLGLSALTWGLVLVFIGGAGKSAMFPLHIWLPDAMEGPTPVSALIHAATMVVAGVFLVARLFPIFALSDQAALNIVAYIGIISALFAAIIACTQTDIKRVLAFSTMSQIGYMMFALGVSGYGGEEGAGFSASLFHLFTHAFFKSLLFLGAGSIIHMVHSNEMGHMGGLRKYMPITHLSFLIACLAISGIPPFAGFFSKEAILHAAHHNHPGIYYLGLFTSMLTAFYMFRLYFSIFWSKESKDHSHHSEGTWSMKIPLIILSIASILVGFVPFSSYVSSDGLGLESHLDWMFSIAPVGLALLGIGFAAYLYMKENDKPENIANSLGSIFIWVKHKFYIDELYLFITKKVIFNLVGKPAAWIDKNIIDGFYALSAGLTTAVSFSIRGIQSGKVQGYALYFFGGILGLAILFIYIMN